MVITEEYGASVGDDRKFLSSTTHSGQSIAENVWFCILSAAHFQLIWTIDDVNGYHIFINDVL